MTTQEAIGQVFENGRRQGYEEGKRDAVKRGRWAHCSGKSNLWYCSVCGEKILYNSTRRTYNIEKRPVHEVNKHCRNCGADMRGGNDG